MNDLIKASLNLHAVLQNLEDLVQCDPEAAAMSRAFRIAIQFSVYNGPQANVSFADGRCTVRRGKHRSQVTLFFRNPAHLNQMFDGKANPIPLKGFLKLGFLSNEFTKLTERLTYFLKPTPELLNDPAYLEINTRLSLNTAAFAVSTLAALDPVGKQCAARMGKGVVLIKVLPKGPAVTIDFQENSVQPGKGDTDKPMARLLIKDMPTASRFVNNKLDTFASVVNGDIQIAGRLPMVDNLGFILDRLPLYLS